MRVPFLSGGDLKMGDGIGSGRSDADSGHSRESGENIACFGVKVKLVLQLY